jgi:hypothetical protein
MTERRYDEREVAAIFQEAAESRLPAQRLSPAAEGLTLAQLQEIGRDVGIPAESIARAARTVGEPGAETTHTFLGFPIGVAHTVPLGRRVSTEEWERLVVDLRETFERRGTVASHGSLRQWTNGGLQALVEPTAGGDRLRLRTTKTDAKGMLGGGLGMLLAALAIFVAAMLRGAGGDIGMLLATAVLALFGIAMFASSALRLPQWAATRRRQMEEIAGRIALADPSNDEQH